METKEKWTSKDRHYFLKGNREPITFKLGSRHTNRHSLLYFDTEKGHQRELRYASNQKSPFVDEQEGPITLRHIIFENGTLPIVCLPTSSGTGSEATQFAVFTDRATGTKAAIASSRVGISPSL